jgi:predicted metal-dependent phosphoesterase TrpH
MKFTWTKDTDGVWKDDINLRLPQRGDRLVGWMRHEQGVWNAVQASGGRLWESKQFDNMREAMRWLRQQVLMQVLAGEL